jgi:hypothetical protein
VNSIDAVPEPGTSLLVALGLFSIAGVSRMAVAAKRRSFGRQPINTSSRSALGVHPALGSTSGGAGLE